jgi:hypothetical protein
MSNLSALEGLGLVKAAISDLKKEDCSNYDQNIHVLFKNMYNTLFECTEFLEMQKMKGGAHV